MKFKICIFRQHFFVNANFIKHNIYIYIYKKPKQPLVTLQIQYTKNWFCFVELLWHINHCGLFNIKSSLYKYISNIHEM